MYVKPTTIYGSLIPGSEYIRSLVRQGTISQDAARRLRWFDFYNRCGDARLTCRHFGLSPQTFYRWKNRLDPYDLTTLEASSRRPHSDDGRWQFSSRDLISRWGVSRVYRRATSFTASLFLEDMQRKFPFSIRAIQIDGGSEFQKHFDEACRERGIRLFIIPARTPQLQGYVESANKTYRYEFYEVEDIALGLEEHNQQLEEWDKTYNYIRPHQSLAYLTPAEYYQGWLKSHPQPSASLM